jgi:hypothetical protein
LATIARQSLSLGTQFRVTAIFLGTDLDPTGGRDDKFL